jgi:GNAT superfamily N-acetyltransferase
MQKKSQGVRLATVEDISAMQEIERAAGRLFAGIGMADVAAHPPPARSILTEYVGGGRAWIGETAGEVAGYALADEIDGCGHLEQISVDPKYGRQGLGRLLIRTVMEWATSRGLPAVTLLTFRDVPWNGPYYASLGFRPLTHEETTPGLARLRRHEDELGLDRSARIAMRLELAERGPRNPQ